jgi:hypothetical protein
VTSVDDDDANNERVTITYEIAGANYAGATSENVTVTVTDNDTAGVTNSSDTRIINAFNLMGNCHTLVVSISINSTCYKNGLWCVPIGTSKGHSATYSGSACIITIRRNRQTVTVTSVDDDDANNESVTITYEIAGANYAGATSENVTVLYHHY